MTASPQIQQLISESALAEIKRLELRTARRATAELSGSYRSSFRGSGLTFSDLREYQPGDDTKHIHWKASARSGKIYIKSFEEERALTIMLALDVSASTAFGSPQTQQQRAREFCALVALLASRNRDSVGLTLFASDILEHLPARLRRSQFHQIISTLLTKHELQSGTDFSTLIRHLRTHARRRSVILLVSDFLAEIPQQELTALALKHDLILVKLSSPIEDLKECGLIEFRDAESGELLVIDSSEIYKIGERIKNHHEQLKNFVQSCGAELIELQASSSRTLIELSQRRKRLRT